MLTMQSCSAGEYDTFIGHCKCAALDARYVFARIAEERRLLDPPLPTRLNPSPTHKPQFSTMVMQELVDYSITPALPLLVQPSKTEPGSVDYGASYERVGLSVHAGPT